MSTGPAGERADGAAVGVIVPVRGPAPDLPEALDSALAQDPAPNAVVVVDDGSAEPLRLSADHAERCRLVRRERRGGPAAARQGGLEALAALDAPLVALLDADDAWEPGKLAAQLAALHRHPSAPLCFGRATVVGPGGEPTGARLAEPPAGLLENPELARLLYRGNPIPTSSALVRRPALLAAGGFDGGIASTWCEDWDLWLRLARAGGGFVCEPRARVRYRRHAGGLSRDLAAIAEWGLRLQQREASTVDSETRRGATADQLTLLGLGRVRQRRYREARAALAEAARHAPAQPRVRLLRHALAVPGLRAALGRRSPYPRGRAIS